MSLDKNLTGLKKVGKDISEDNLRQVGAAGVHLMIKEKHPGETLSTCYYLYSFERALTDKHLDGICEHKKQSPKSQSLVKEKLYHTVHQRGFSRLNA